MVLTNMADVNYLKVIAIVNRSSSEGPSGHTNSVFMRKDKKWMPNYSKTDIPESDCTAGVK